jgi:hypothetical protein
LRAARLGRSLAAAVTDRFIGVTGGSSSAADSDGGGDSNWTRGLSAGGFDRRWRSILCQKNFRWIERDMTHKKFTHLITGGQFYTSFHKFKPILFSG